MTQQLPSTLGSQLPRVNQGNDATPRCSNTQWFELFAGHALVPSVPSIC